MLHKRESYNYSVDVDNGEIYCSFNTGECDYTVYFNPNEYNNRISLYPQLLENSFGFGFFQFPKDSTKVPAIDVKIKHTIEDIVRNFYRDFPDSILLYHCDYADGRQDKRSKKFHRWYSASEARNSIWKHEIALDILEGSEYITHYIGYLCSTENKKIENVKMEFELFALDLASASK